MHLTLDHYILALRGVMAWDFLVLQGHHHLLELCTTCRDEWGGGRSLLQGTGQATSTQEPVPPSDPRSIACSTIQEAQRHLSRMRCVARRAREDLARLRGVPAQRWPELVANATTRFRSRAFLELLLETSRQATRNSPREAEALAALVGVVLGQRGLPQESDWVQILRVRAAAHHANALRVSGKLRAAEGVFLELRRRSDSRPLPPEVQAEILSLESSLRIDQSRFSEALVLLKKACAAIGPGRPPCALLIKHANMLVVTGRVNESLAMFERAAEALNPAREPELRPVIIAGRINALCDLERYEEAGRLLKSTAGVFPKKGDAHATALYCLHSARVSAGLGDLAAAEAGFLRSRDQFLALGREYDAISTSLYLADTLFASGKTKELGRLAADLVPLFRSCGVELETLAALRLLTEATRNETLTGATLGRLRRHLMAPRPVAATASEADPI